MPIWVLTTIGSISNVCRRRGSRVFLSGSKITNLRLRSARQCLAELNQIQKPIWEGCSPGWSELASAGRARVAIVLELRIFVIPQHFLLDKNSTKELIVYVHATVY